MSISSGCACGSSCVPSYWSATIKYTCSGDSRNFTAGFDKTIFYCGLTYPEIVLLLFVINNTKISLLNKILKSNNLRRHTGYIPEHIVKIYISNEIDTSGKCIGYRYMWKRLVNEHRIRVRELKFYLSWKLLTLKEFLCGRLTDYKDASTVQKDLLCLACRRIWQTKPLWVLYTRFNWRLQQ